MNYHQIIEKLTSDLKTKSDFANVLEAAELLGHPEKDFPAVHVTGTNGKGSVSLKIATSLSRNGYRCGLFTSPHLSCFRERIRIGNELIPEKDVASITEELFRLGLPLTYFEYCTFLAFIYFSRAKVDIAVIEVGLGGRLDATNIVRPILSIITSVSFDHMEILGSTLDAIAEEKAGIIKPNVPTLIGPSVPKHVIEAKCHSLKAPLTIVQGTYSHYGEENEAIAKEALKIINPSIIPHCSIEPPCRFELVPKERLSRTQFSQYQDIPIILDVAHNPDGIEKLLMRLRFTYPNAAFHFLLNFSSSKDLARCAEQLIAAKSIRILNIENSRFASYEELKKHFPSATYHSPDECLQLTLQSAKKEDVVVVCGSFFIMGSVRKLLGYQDWTDC